MVLEQLSNAQLAHVYAQVTGQRVSRFTNIAIGCRRVRKALETAGMSEALALRVAGFGSRDDDADLKYDGDRVAAVVELAATDDAKPCEKVEGVDYEMTTDAYGFRHRKPLNGDAKRKSKSKGEKKARGASSGKLQQVLAMLRRDEGATVPEIAEAMGWLPHTTRAYLSKGGAGGKAATIMRKVDRNGKKKVTIYSVR